MKKQDKIRILNFSIYYTKLVIVILICLVIVGTLIRNIYVFKILLIIAVAIATIVFMLMVLKVLKREGEKDSLEVKREVYSYCDFCGEEIQIGNKYHHACLIKKYKGIVIKNERKKEIKNEEVIEL